MRQSSQFSFAVVQRIAIAGNVPCVSANRANHECPFPETLAERMFRLYSYVNGLVIDPFLGTGTSAAVATRLRRRFIGCEWFAKNARHAYARTMQAISDREQGKGQHHERMPADELDDKEDEE